MSATRVLFGGFTLILAVALFFGIRHLRHKNVGQKQPSIVKFSPTTEVGQAIAPVPVQPESTVCAQLSRQIIHSIKRAPLTAEPAASLSDLTILPQLAFGECSNSESTWYLYLRLIEIGLIKNHDTMATLTDIVTKRFQKSSRVKTVLARMTGDVNIAKETTTADPDYLPARVVYASNLLRQDTSNANQVVTLLENLPRLKDTVNGVATLAQAFFSSGNYHSAIKMCSHEDESPLNPLEITVDDATRYQFTACSLVKYQSLIALGQKDAGILGLLHMVVNEQSREAKTILISLLPKIRDDLKQLSKVDKLSQKEKALSMEILSTGNE